MAVSNSSCGSADVSTTKHCALCWTKLGGQCGVHCQTEKGKRRSSNIRPKDSRTQEADQLQKLTWWRNSIRVCQGRWRGWLCGALGLTWTSSSPHTGTFLTRGGVMRTRMRRGRMKDPLTSRPWEVDKVHSSPSHFVTTHYRFTGVLSAQPYKFC